ncbi:SufS family cysteine desulfurase [Candidatus Nomurabacteria bacterium]|uniref:Cysteine desulfurase n=1 Tax=Candidatus Dojkabacteria bacterium TaxID=2099670 RepID=A0A955I242_9BACT|nr:SufS family cysteine desulfurase [Candidatus Dojkabacteria bacterium]MCB9789658.1 SufS family cysteine desulfurase [Candidatus Nomurabacteria bacterium]MCB9804001.1 SufS family cysteine desulfurase [Candidatus Nomurabacteria bacterium]
MDDIRSQFPILQREVNGKQLVYLDNAATTQKPKQVIDSITNYYTNYNANVHRGLHTLSTEATNAYEEAHRKAADLIGATPEEVFFVSNATEGLNFICNTVAEQGLEEGDVVVITEMEHHSNIVPWQMASRRKKFKLEWIPVTESASGLDLSYLEFLVRKYREKLKLISFVHISNVLGVKTDVKKVVEIAKTVGALTVLDATQTVAHTQIDVGELDIDYLVFSGHKMFGPTGIGVVYGKHELLEETEPWLGGGDMISKVWKNGAEWAELPWRFEAGTPNIAGGVGLMSAIDWMANNLLMTQVEAHEKALTKIAVEGLKRDSRIKIFGPDDADKRNSLVSFVVNGMHPHDVSSMLDEYGIAVRAGYHCAEPLHKRFNMQPTVRASFSVYNTEDEVKYFLEILDKVISEFVG